MIFPTLGGWLFAYILPILLVVAVIRFFPEYRAGTLFRGAVVHIGLLVSIVLSQYLLYAVERSFPWNFRLASIFSFIGVAVAIFVILGRFGLFYTFSALIQQLTMTSIAYYLYGPLSFFFIVILVVPPYSLSHLFQPKYWQVKIPVTLLWGFISLALFFLWQDVFLNALVHAIAGAFFIRRGVMYPQNEFAIKRGKTPI